MTESGGMRPGSCVGPEQTAADDALCVEESQCLISRRSQADHVSCASASRPSPVPFGEKMATIELYGREVIPRVRELLAEPPVDPASVGTHAVAGT